MKMRHALVLLVIPAALMCVSCSSDGDGDGNGGPGPGDTTPPEASSVSIADGATDIGLIQHIEVTFSEAMAESTINDATFGVSERSVGGHVEYDADTHTASFLPDTLYAPESPHEFFVTAGATDEAGNPITAFTRSFETGPLDCAHLDDRFEPNDGLSEAVPVQLNTRYRTLTICEDDRDTYTFTVEETVMVRMHQWFKHNDEVEDNFATVFLRGENDRYVSSGWAPNTGDSSKQFHFTFHPGTYYLDIYSNDDPVYTLYDFALTTESPCPDDAYEDNDFVDEAVFITPGTIMGLRACWLDRDFFAVQLDAGETLTVTVTAQPDAGTRRLMFYDTLGNEAAGWTNSENPLTRSYVAGPAGIYFFKVRFWMDDVEYDIDVEVTD